MNKTTKLILSFCGITLLLGGILFGVGMYFGERTQQNPWFGKDVWGDIDIKVDGAQLSVGNYVECIEKKETLNAFENITMEAECANVRIIMGEEYQITCVYPENEMPQFNVENGTLKVTQDKQEDYQNTGNVTRSIIITIPKQTVLKEVSLENIVGNIWVEDIDAYSYMTTLTTGNVEIHNAELESCMVTISTGNIKTSKLMADYCGMSTSTGEIDIIESDVKEYVIVNGVGDTTLDLSRVTYDYSINAETNVGKVYLNGDEKGLDYEVEKSGEYRIEIGKNVGDINIKTQ